MSGNPLLESLNCEKNKLVSIDISKNSAMTTFSASNNYLLRVDGMRAMENSFAADTQTAYLPSNKLVAYADMTVGGVDYKAGATITVKDGDSFSVGEGNPSISGTLKVGIPVEASFFPDGAFRNYISDTLDIDENSVLSPEEIAAVKIIEILDAGVSDLTGIEYFTELTELYISNNQLTSLDMSGNPKLVKLNCSNNRLTSLDVTKNPALKQLTCSNNQLTTLDVTKNPALTVLNFDVNRMSEIDLSQNPELQVIKCNNNQLIHLDLSNNPELGVLHCGNNQLMELDLKNNTALSVLSCFGNQLVHISDFDIMMGDDVGSQVVALSEPTFAAPEVMTVDGVEYAAGTEIDVKDGDAFSYADANVFGVFRVGVIPVSGHYFPDPAFRAYVDENFDTEDDNMLTAEEIAAVTKIDLEAAGITTVKDMTGLAYFTALSVLNCASNELTALDVTANTALTKLNCSGNQMTALDVTKQPLLEVLNCGGNQLDNLDVSANAKLTTLDCSDNALFLINTYSNPLLAYLDCSNNEITRINMYPNPAIETLIFNHNAVSSMYVNDCPELTVLDGASNQLKNVNVSNCAKLQSLNLSENQLDSINLGRNAVLTSLDIGANKLTKLDVSQNTLLEELRTASNQLTVLDISANPALQELDCSYNLLTKLDVSKNQMLEELYCRNNRIFFIENLPVLEDCDLSGQAVYIPGTTVTAPAKIVTTGGTYAKDAEFTVEDGHEFSYSQITNVSGSFHIGIPLDAAYFPDNNFRAYIAERCDPDKNAFLTPEELEAVEELYVTDKGIADLTGVGYFKNLKRLQAGYNNLTELDLSGNTALESLLVYSNALTALDVTMLPELVTLNCSSCGLTELDVTENAKLDYLDCETNALTELDLSGNPVLETLECAGNQLTELDVSENPLLESLSCGRNRLTELHLENNPVLDKLYCDRNSLKELDVTNNPDLGELSCYDNQLTKLLVTKEQYITVVGVAGNQLLYIENLSTSELDGRDQVVYLSSKTLVAPADMVVAGVTYTKGSEVPVADEDKFSYAGTNVEGTFRVGIPITEEFFPDDIFRSYVDEKFDTVLDEDFLTGDEIAKILAVDVHGMGIESLKGIEHFANMTQLICMDNKLTELDVSGNPALVMLDCNGNQLTTLDVSQNPKLEMLDCSENLLTELKLAGCTTLQTVFCSMNKLTALDVSGCTALRTVLCSMNKLTALDVSDCTALTALQCSDNPLTALDLTSNSALTRVEANNTHLTSLDLSGCPEMQFSSALNCYYLMTPTGNKIDLSKLPGKFDPAMASNWSNATVEGSIVTVGNFAQSVRYIYELGDGSNALFEIRFNEIELTADMVTGTDNVVYAGKALFPVDLKFGDYTLVYGIDYAISYENNVNVGTASYTIEAMPYRGFTGSLSGEFTIAPLDLSNAVITLDTDKLTYNTTQQTVQVQSVKVGDVSVLSEYYTVSGNTATDAGDYAVTITGSGNCTGTAKASYVVAPLDISNATVTLADSLVFNGTVQAQEIAYVLVDNIIIPAENYVVSDNEKMDAGDYQLDIKGIRNCTGSLVVDWSIAKAKTELTGAPAGMLLEYAASDQALVTQGTAVGGTVMYAISDNTTTPPDDSEFSQVVPYAKDAGTYHIWYYAKADGINYDTDTQKYCVTSEIEPYPLEKATVDGTLSYEYSTVDMTDYVLNGFSMYLMTPDGKEMLCAIDHQTDTTYRILNEAGEVVDEMVNAGVYTFAYTGKGNYVGEKSVDITITKDPTIPNVTPGDELYYTGSEQTMVFDVDYNGNPISVEDYTVTGDTETDAGDYTATITFKNYAPTV